MDSNKTIVREPAIAWFPREGGPMGVYRKVFAQLQKKRWSCRMYFESGCMPKEIVLGAVPRGFGVEYLSYPRYSSTDTSNHKKTALDLGGRC